MEIQACSATYSQPEQAGPALVRRPTERWGVGAAGWWNGRVVERWSVEVVERWSGWALDGAHRPLTVMAAFIAAIRASTVGAQTAGTITAATAMCQGSGAPGLPWPRTFPGVPPALSALLGAAPMLAAILPLLIIVVTATPIARTIEQRSIDDARLTDDHVRKRQQERQGGSRRCLLRA